MVSKKHLALALLLTAACSRSKANKVDDADVVLSREEGGSVVVMTLRKLDVARKFAQEIPEDVKRKSRTEPTFCEKDKRPLEPVVITTGGPAGNPNVWRAYPLAVDGWRCPVCGEHEYPAFLEPMEVTELLNSGAEAARRGDLDEAEYKFRRVVSSWPGYADGRVNLGSLYLDRAKAERTHPGGAPENIQRYGDEAIRQLEKALACNPPPPGAVRFILGKAHVRSGDREKGRSLLRKFLEDSGADPSRRSEAEALLTE